jgi:hypothetical protein
LSGNPRQGHCCLPRRPDARSRDCLDSTPGGRPRQRKTSTQAWPAPLGPRRGDRGRAGGLPARRRAWAPGPTMCLPVSLAARARAEGRHGAPNDGWRSGVLVFVSTSKRRRRSASSSTAPSPRFEDSRVSRGACWLELLDIRLFRRYVRGDTVTRAANGGGGGSEPLSHEWLRRVPCGALSLPLSPSRYLEDRRRPFV